jgi:hypothetical protein
MEDHVGVPGARIKIKVVILSMYYTLVLNLQD